LGGPKTKEQNPKVQEKDLKIDPSGFEIGMPREWVENSKGSIFRPFPWVKTIGNFSFHFMAPKCIVGMTLNLFFTEFVDHVIYHLPQKHLKRSDTHGLNIKWNIRHGPDWLIYRPLPWSVALCARILCLNSL